MALFIGLSCGEGRGPGVHPDSDGEAATNLNLSF